MTSLFSDRTKCGFTILELLVAMAVSILLIALLAQVTWQASDTSRSVQSSLTRSNTGASVLDFVAADVQSLVSFSKPVEFLQARIPNDGTGLVIDGTNVAMQLMLNSMSPLDAVSGTDRGLARAVCYRMAYQDPILLTGSNRVYSIYRTVADQLVTFGTNGTGALETTDLYDGFWRPRILAEDQQNSPPREDFLAGNVVDFQCLLLGGTTRTQVLNAALTNGSRPQGFRLSGTSTIVGTSGTTRPTSMEITLTVVDDRGAELLRTGAVRYAEVVKRYGQTYVRRVPLYLKP